MTKPLQIAVAATLIAATTAAFGGVRIDEIMASNRSSLTTRNGGKEMDWVELFNDGDADVDVAGWFLSDKPDAKPAKWKKINGRCIVPAGGRAIVWCDKDYDDFAEDEAYVRMAISSSGESVFLAPPSTVILDVVEVIDLPAQVKDRSYGRLADWTFAYFTKPTPGEPNGDESQKPMTPVVAFDPPHGYMGAPFDLKLLCPDDPSAEIRYTLDGTSPTTNSALYAGPIRIERTTCVRAAVPREGAALQRDSAATYIFLDEVLRQQNSAKSPGAGFPDDMAVNGHAMRYGLIQSVVNGKDRDRLLRGFTNSIPTLSFVIDPTFLFDRKKGIYVNPRDEGRGSERMLIVEQIDPRDPSNGFTIPAGLRIRGAHSRGNNRPKHSLRLFFRSEYGESRLRFPLFGDERGAATEFDKFDLRTSQNHSWANDGDGSDTYIHEVFSRDSQRDMGQPYTRSRFCHLFINGQYWGMYQTQERGDEHFAASYLGGDSLDFDLVKTAFNPRKSPPYTIGVNEGTIDAWSNLWHTAVKEGFGKGHEGNRLRLLGRDKDGRRDKALPILLNERNLIDYMLIFHWTADCDSPVSTFNGSDPHCNNLYALFNRRGTGLVNGFVFLRHDAEHSLGKSSMDFRSDPTLVGSEVWPKWAHSDFMRRLDHFNPAELHYRLCDDPDYRMAFADEFYRQCIRPGGALTVEKATERFRRRMDEIDDAIVCESARWGGGRDGNRNFTRDKTWLPACTGCFNFITNRTQHLTTHYRKRGWYPSVEPPVPTGPDGERLLDGATVPGGGPVTLSAAGPGRVLYTLDGSDPRSPGGAVSATAAEPPSDGIRLPKGLTTLRARLLSDKGEWSALEEVVLFATI
ncbi:MAG: chitobiase/beta-hexosaminidase C-terminal domain-containing protein [Kiritimatiellae bacterium]|nr:chitobiase/beta-hexosaminidase C-terminal domain-containing protein [Kiritimatiellia bacterium]